MYQDRLKNYNSVDFGDLMKMLPLKILKEKELLLDYYRKI